MRDLNHDFKELCRHNRDGSYATQADRANILDLVANQLHEMGVRGLRAQGFKPLLRSPRYPISYNWLATRSRM